MSTNFSPSAGIPAGFTLLRRAVLDDVRTKMEAMQEILETTCHEGTDAKTRRVLLHGMQVLLPALLRDLQSHAWGAPTAEEHTFMCEGPGASHVQ